MAKKKKRKENKTKDNSYKVGFLGVVFVLLSIIGFGSFGIAGNITKSFAIFLFGTWYAIFLVGIFVIGAYLIIKRESPNFLSAKLIGLYVVILSILVLSHTAYIENNDLSGYDVISETINNFMASITNARDPQGGGIIGGLFSLLFVKLFDLKGTKIVIIVLLCSGIGLFTGFSIVDFVKKCGSKTKQALLNKKENKEKERIVSSIKTAEEKYENDNKVVVSSIDELIHVPHEEIKTESKEEIKEDQDYELDTSGYTYPPMSLLHKPSKNKNSETPEVIKHNVLVLEQVFKDFNIEGKVVAINPGPAVTQYEMEVKSGTKLSRVLSIHSEIALALAAKDVRIQAPIPGKSTIGVEIPNKATAMVNVREILELVPKQYADSKLLVTLGRDIMGRPQYCEINKTPHLLVAGSTGSGKSVCINSIITSILMRTKPDEVKLVLVDPKKVELSMYNGVPHLKVPVVTDPKKANIALKKIVVEMENRYELFSNSGTKNIAGYNAYIEKKNETLPQEEKLHKLPYIVVIIDELADLMLVAAKEVEDSIMRITQMARAAGIHLIVATQRPSTDVITGVVKANIPSRISFAVSSQIDSRTILDMAGAEKLLGKGDMLFLPQGENTPIRIQGTFIDDDEIKNVVDYTIKQQIARYDETFLMDEDEMHATTMIDSDEDYEEPLYNEIVEFVITQGKASASLLQRRFRLGYNRAARVIDLLEERGIIGPNNGSKPREVLVKLEDKE